MSAAIDYAYNAFCEERFSLPSEQEVAALEGRIGAPLPGDYREFLLEYNGGIFAEPDIQPPVAGCPSDRLTFLSGIHATDACAELANDGDLALFSDNDPLQILAIGYTMMGNLLALVVRAEDCGSVLLKKAWSDQWFVLAEGIEEFFSLLAEPQSD